MKITLARQIEAAQALRRAFVDEAWPEDVSQADVEAVVTTLDWLALLRNDVIDLRRQINLAPKPIPAADIERLMNHPAVIAIMTVFPDAKIG